MHPPVSTPNVTGDEVGDLGLSRLVVQDAAPGSRWTKRADNMLTSLVKKGGTRWDKFRQLLPGRSPAAMRSRYYRLTKGCNDTRVILVRPAVDGQPGVVSLMTTCAHRITLPNLEDTDEELREILYGSTDFPVSHENSSFWVKCRLCNDCVIHASSWVTINLETVLADDHICWRSTTDKLLFAYAMEYLYDLIFLESKQNAGPLKLESKVVIYGIVPEDLHQHVHVASCPGVDYEVCSDIVTVHSSLAAKVRFPVRLRLRAKITTSNIQQLTFLCGSDRTDFPNGFVEVQGGTFSLTGFAELTLYHFSDYVVAKKRDELTPEQRHELSNPISQRKRYILGSIVNASRHLIQARIESVPTSSKEASERKIGGTFSLTPLFAKISIPYARLFKNERVFASRSQNTGIMEPGEEMILVPCSGELVHFDVLLKGAVVHFYFLSPPQVDHSSDELPISLSLTEERADTITQQMENNPQIMWLAQACKEKPHETAKYVQRLNSSLKQFVWDHEQEFCQLHRMPFNYCKDDWRFAKQVHISAKPTTTTLTDEHCHKLAPKAPHLSEDAK